MPPKKGNKNAIKHGIYAKFIAVIDDEQMAGMSDENPADELAVARLQLANALQKKKEAPTTEDYWKADYAVHHWVEIITNIKARKIEQRKTETMIWTSLMDAIDYWNDKQNVQR